MNEDFYENNKVIHAVVEVAKIPSFASIIVIVGKVR